MANALRRRWPNAFIAWAVQAPADQILRTHPAVNEVIRVPKGYLLKPSVMLQLRRQLRAHRFDVSIDPQGLTKSATLAWLSGARLRIGPGKPYARELSPWLNNRLVSTQATHLVDRSLDLLVPLGVDDRSVEFGIRLESVAIEHMQCYLQRQPGACRVVINPGAGWPSKQWDNDRFAAVAKQLHANHSADCIVVWGNEKEQSDAKAIVAAAGRAARLAPATNIPQLAALLRQVDLYIGCDTGPTHLAAALGTPCITLYGPTRPEYSGAYDPAVNLRRSLAAKSRSEKPCPISLAAAIPAATAPQSLGHVHLQKSWRPLSSRQKRRGDNAAMMLLTVSDVVDACRPICLSAVARRAA